MPSSELEERARKRVGEVLGKYRLDDVLGVGGMAVVYAATHRNQKKVAIKMLLPELSIREEIKSRFLREGYAANTVDHPGAVAVLDDDTAADGSAFLVMERLEGAEVERLSAERGDRLEIDVVLAIADALLDVLSAAHAKSIVHRDIKPSNLYVLRDGSLKVLDFGIARLRDATMGGATATATGMMLGTPAFMAPEQALGKSKEIDATTDIWAVGATMFFLLSGKFVHEGENASQIVIAAATTAARSLATVAPWVDATVVALVDRALAYERADRWPSAQAMREAVRKAALALFGRKLGRAPLQRLMGTEPDSERAPLVHPSAPPPRASSAPGPLAGPGYTRPHLTVDDPAAAAPPQARFAPQPAPGVPPTQSMAAAPPASRVAAPIYSPPPGYAPGGLVVQQPHGRAAHPTTAMALTAHPEDEAPAIPGVGGSRGRVVLLAAVALVLAAAAFAGVLAVYPRSAASGSADPPQKPAATAPITPLPSAPPPSTSAPPAASTAPAPQPPPGPAPAPAPTPAPSTPPRTSPGPMPRGGSKPAAPLPNCDPPYTVVNGIKRPKPECE